MNSFSLVVALLMGLTGSLHCAGMCGPIMLILPFHAFTDFKKWIALLLYHFGRITIYALLGLVLYSFKSAFNPEWQQYISMGLGGMLLIAGAVSFISSGKHHIQLPFANAVKKGLSRFVSNPSLGALFMSGALNGLLPCGLVYMALSMAVTAPSVPLAMLSMYMFGLGTIPALVAIVLLKGRLRLAGNVNLRKMVPVIMLFFGCIFMLRGMNLGIPYVSPKIEMENKVVKASCCHKAVKD